ncbi:MAG: Transcriptional regulator, ArsR family [uncultured Solirubrobacterales bacterium]|uniref:Transcriptional regulator, ArsR family n=1 Tax=uncultured Solirubrobacterales bacterium TaxID=768556 RepID=A0A6J4S061_9ACTN|nr:MAG: Transcriptional regulator, ArsR family [uncultured Solirubrobacterales bacterium]
MIVLHDSNIARNVRAPSHPSTDDLRLPEVLHALSDPVRLEIVCALNEGSEVACGHLEAPVSKSTLSHHLKVLRDAGVTRTRADGTQRLVSLRLEELERRFPGLLGSVVDGARSLG